MFKPNVPKKKGGFCSVFMCRLRIYFPFCVERQKGASRKVRRKCILRINILGVLQPYIHVRPFPELHMTILRSLDTPVCQNESAQDS